MNFPHSLSELVTLVNAVIWIAASLGPDIASAQQPDTLWTQTFGGPGSESCFLGQETSDSGFILGGHTSSLGAGGYDMYMVKTDSMGTLVWETTFGGPLWDDCRSIQQTDDGGYILAGYTTSFGAGDSDMYLVKTDSLGNLVWQRTFGGALADDCYFVRQTPDGGYILCGYTRSFANGPMDFYLVRTDQQGIMEWERVFGGVEDERGHCVRLTADGGYILAGFSSTYGAGGRDIYVVKTDASGNWVWDNTTEG
ncbi:MAG: hypothetical protein ABIE92_05040 [bacterium]